MILRIVLSVVLTAALLAVAMPLLSTASADSADSTVSRQLTALGDRLQRLVDTNDPTAGRGARHVTTVTIPGRTLTSAGVRHLRLYSHEGVGLATWQVGESRTASTRLVDVPLRAAGGNLTLREPGTQRLAFDLRSKGNRTVLWVRRLETGGVTDA